MKKSLLLLIFTVSIITPKVYAQSCPPILNYDTLGSQLEILDLGFGTPYGIYPPWYLSCSWYGGLGDERFVKFNPPSAGNYRLEIWSYVQSPNNFYSPVEFYFSETNDT